MDKPCTLSNERCEYAEIRTFNYGFVNGTALYCDHERGKRFVDKLIGCPKGKQEE